jgi:ATP-dependent Clp protease protease subunit
MIRKNKFYNFARDENTGGRELFIDGEISSELWFGDEITPRDFKEQLFEGNGNITIWISSPGGDVIAASEIYSMLRDYQGEITVKIYGMAASAATVISMAGDKILMSPTALFLIHNPWTIAVGDKSEMQKAGATLDAVKESIINAYELKTGLPRSKISRLMDLEQPMDANYAIALGFVDGIIETEKNSDLTPKIEPENSQKTENKTPEKPPNQSENQDKNKTQKSENKTKIQSCYARLNLLSGGKF